MPSLYEFLSRYDKNNKYKVYIDGVIVFNGEPVCWSDDKLWLEELPHSINLCKLVRYVDFDTSTIYCGDRMSYDAPRCSVVKYIGLELRR